MANLAAEYLKLVSEDFAELDLKARVSATEPVAQFQKFTRF
jgi:hypothetical protein